MTMDIEYADIDDIPDAIGIQPYMYVEPLPRPNVQESSEESDASDESYQQDRGLNTYWLVYI